MYKLFLKRLGDIVLSALALICISWLVLLVALCLHFANKGAGAFFTQNRLGKNGRLFKLIKFKTMTDERNEQGELCPDEQRLTKIGRFVRSVSLDELPQLVNILKGDMSLIGPRPLTPVYFKVFNKEQARRMEVRPGLTGWAQVHGRNHCKLSKKFEMDVWYVDHYSMSLDLKIIALTAINVLKREDVGLGAADMKEVDDLGFLDKMMELQAKGELE